MNPFMKFRVPIPERVFQFPGRRPQSFESRKCREGGGYNVLSPDQSIKQPNKSLNHRTILPINQSNKENHYKRAWFQLAWLSTHCSWTLVRKIRPRVCWPRKRSRPVQLQFLWRRIAADDCRCSGTMNLAWPSSSSMRTRSPSRSSWRPCPDWWLYSWHGDQIGLRSLRLDIYGQKSWRQRSCVSQFEKAKNQTHQTVFPAKWRKCCP